MHPVASAEFEARGDTNTVSMDWARLNDQKEPVDLDLARELPAANEIAGGSRGRKVCTVFSWVPFVSICFF